MKRKAKIKLPRQLWCIKPFDRIHEGKKGYDRKRDKRAVEREAMLDYSKWIEEGS